MALSNIRINRRENAAHYKQQTQTELNGSWKYPKLKKNTLELTLIVFLRRQTDVCWLNQ